MKLPIHLLPLTVVALMLGGCGGGSDSNSAGLARPAANFNSVATRPADTDPAALEDPDRLSADIAAIFGEADDAPTDVREDDNVTLVVLRAGM